MNARQTGFTFQLRGRSLPTVTFMFRRAWCRESGPPRSREAFGSDPGQQPGAISRLYLMASGPANTLLTGNARIPSTCPSSTWSLAGQRLSKFRLIFFRPAAQFSPWHEISVIYFSDGRRKCLVMSKGISGNCFSGTAGFFWTKMLVVVGPLRSKEVRRPGVLDEIVAGGAHKLNVG